MKAAHLASLVVIAALLVASPASAQPADELKALRQDIDAIKKDLQEIKEMLRARPAPQAARPAVAPAPDIPLDLAGAAVKGATAARVVLLEYSDYQ